MRKFWILLWLQIPLASWGYPEFIGYGYSSCITCHYNGNGNGPLNDYGRAVWAGELVARTFVGKTTDEELGERSGFLGPSNRTAWWLRPGFKARGINVQKNPRSANASNRNILMQSEVNAAFHFDKQDELIFVGSLGYAPNPYRMGATGDRAPTVISREHYLRWHASKNLWVYAGFTDKVYGIRHVNHTAFSREKTGLGQNDQSDGVILQYIEDDWEMSGHVFVGNTFQGSDLRQDGGSVMFEYNLQNNWRLGASVLSSSNKYVRHDRFAVHSRIGYEDGVALLWEIGTIGNTPLNNTSPKNGYYVFSELTQRLARGYHFVMTGQAYKANLYSRDPDDLKAGGGLLIFPYPRMELRFEIENSRLISEESVSRDNLAVMSQLHISL